MSTLTFATLPREIRDRIYDCVWDLGQMVFDVQAILNAKRPSFQ